MLIPKEIIEIIENTRKNVEKNPVVRYEIDHETNINEIIENITNNLTEKELNKLLVLYIKVEKNNNICRPINIYLLADNFPILRFDNTKDKPFVSCTLKILSEVVRYTLTRLDLKIKEVLAKYNIERYKTRFDIIKYKDHIRIVYSFLDNVLDEVMYITIYRNGNIIEQFLISKPFKDVINEIEDGIVNSPIIQSQLEKIR